MKRKKPLSQPIPTTCIWSDGRYSIYQRDKDRVHELYRDGEVIHEGTFDQTYDMKQRLSRLK